MKTVFFQLIILFLAQNTLYCQNDWSVQLGKKSYVNINHIQNYQWIPDGHISVLPDGKGQYMMYWSEFENARTTGDSPFPEDQRNLEPVEPVFGGRVGNAGPSNGINDGGSWLMSVHRHNGDTLIGFYHGESHWYPRDGDFTAWKSICVAYSYKLIDISGKMHMKGEVKGHYSELDISDLPSDQYFIVQIFDGSYFMHTDKIFRR